MTITVLIDNALPPDNMNLTAEHGLSFYIETEGKRILCDTGASGLFADNAKAMDIDLAKCDFAFISHGHNDHCGGISRLFETNGHCKAYIHPSVLCEQYYSSRKGEKKSISCEKEVMTTNRQRFKPVDFTKEIADGVFAVQCHCDRHAKPYGNVFLTKNNGKMEVSDDFEHELSLAFTTPKGLVIISPCSHNGVMNIMQECCKATGSDKVSAFIGGFHFVEGEECIKESGIFADGITAHYPDTIFYTGHCTCDTAKKILAGKLKNIRFFTTGTTITI